MVSAKQKPASSASSSSAMMTKTDLIVISTLTAAVVLPYVYYLSRRTDKSISKKDGDDASGRLLPPLASSWGYLETMKTLSGTNAPQAFLEMAHQLGFIFRIRLPYPNHVVVIGEPSLARAILKDPTTRKADLFCKAAGVLIGGDQNIVGIPDNGHRWKHARKSVSHAFSSEQIRRMQNVCHELTEKWIEERLEPDLLTDGEGEGENSAADETITPPITMDVGTELLHLTLSVICKAAFEYNCTKEERDTFLLGVNLGFKEIPAMVGNPLRLTMPFLFPDAKRAHDALQEVQNLAFRILNHYRDKKKEQEDSSAGGTTKEASVPTVISRIVENENYKDDHDRVRDMVVFLLAGHDTTAFSISWILLELSRHEEVMQRLRNELLSLGKNNPDKWINLPYLKQVVKEGLRYQPVGGLGGPRVLGRDFEYTGSMGRSTLTNNSSDDTSEPSVCTYTIPKGSLVFQPMVLFHHHPDVFDRPNEFLPSRWDAPSVDIIGEKGSDSGNGGKVDAAAARLNAYMPFSAGPRNCVGMPLAYAELHYVVGRLVMDYDFEVVDAGTPECFGSYRPTNLRLKVTRVSSRK